MGKDYYQVLGLTRDASDPDIAKSYRKLALKYHPSLSKEDANTTYHYFCGIAEAYEVLSDPIKKAFYDKYGEDQLKDGFFEQGELKGGYRFGGNPEEIFEKFFGTNNAFTQIYDKDNENEYGSLFGGAFGGQNFSGVEAPKTLEVDVECTLNEFYNGCSKQVTYTRQMLNADGRTTAQVDETRELEVKPGYDSKSTIVFKGMGHQVAGQTSSDLVFKFKELPHDQFKRQGNNLVYKATVTLCQALCAEPLTITCLDGRKLYVSIDQVISPTYVKHVQGEGMSIYDAKRITVSNFDQPIEKGDLYIKFDIQFPSNISEQNREQLKTILA